MRNCGKPTSPIGPITYEMKLLRNTAVTMAARLFTMAVHVGIGVLIARMLGPAGRGQLGAVLLVPMTLVGLLHMGFSSSNSVFMGNYPERREQIVSHSIWLALVVGVAAAAILAAVRLWGPRLPGVFGEVDEASYLLALLLLPLGLLNLLLKCALWGANHVGRANLAMTLRVVLYGALVVVFGPWLGLGVFGIVLATLVAALLMLVLLIVSLRRICRVRLRTFDRAFFCKSLGFGVRFWLVGTANMLMLRIDQWMIALMLGDVHLGLYAMAVGIAEKLWTMPSAVSGVVLPHLTNTSKDRVLTTQRAYRNLMAFSAPFYLVLALAGPALIGVLYGQRFAGAALPFLLLLPGTYFMGGSRLMMTYLSAEEKPKRAIYVGWAALVANVALNVALIPVLGIAGAAVASTISYCGAACMWIWAFKRESDSPLKELLPRWGEMRSLLGDLTRRLRPSRNATDQETPTGRHVGDT